MAADLDRARVANKLQLRRWNRFGKFGVYGDRSRGGRNRNGYRDDCATSRQVLVVNVRSASEIVVVMDGRTMMMVAVFRVVRNGVNVEGESLRLQRTQG